MLMISCRASLQLTKVAAGRREVEAHVHHVNSRGEESGATEQEMLALTKQAEENVKSCDKAIAKLFEAIRYNDNLNAAFYWRAEAYRIRVSSLSPVTSATLGQPLVQPS